jgi:hypothetical protein
MLHAHNIRPEPGLFVDVISKQSGCLPVRIPDNGRIPYSGDIDPRVRPILFPPFTPTNDLRENEPTTEKEDGTVHEDFEALGIVKMEPGGRHIPAECNYRTNEQNHETDSIFRPGGTPRRDIIGRTHGCPPIVK